LVSLFRYPKRRLRKLIEKGEYKEAIEFGKSLEEKFSNDSDYFFIMGSIYYILEDAKNTLHYFDKSLEINENDIETLLLKANVHLYLKELNPVIDCCEKVLEIDPKNSRAQEILDNLYEGKEGVKVFFENGRIDILPHSLHVWCKFSEKVTEFCDWLFVNVYQLKS